MLVTVHPVRSYPLVELFQVGQFICEREEQGKLLSGLSVQLLSGSTKQDERILLERLKVLRSTLGGLAIGWPVDEPFGEPVFVESILGEPIRALVD